MQIYYVYLTRVLNQLVGVSNALVGMVDACLKVGTGFLTADGGVAGGCDVR